MITLLEEVRTLGNAALLRLPKTAFFCSREYPPRIEYATYVWAMEQRQLGRCVASGFHSRLEQAVFRFLRQDRQQPIVYGLGRGIQPSVAFEHEQDIRLGHLLFVSHFEPEQTTISQETADIRNLLLADIADVLFIPYMSPGGNLEWLVNHVVARSKPLFTLDVPGNAALHQPHVQLYHPPGLLGGHRANL
ncbi:hypothetical protein [Hymenobacter rubripertinctus]|uniref:Uncharacterized protein n=1 Tax=Hymenobacter rubripertinctus TaxID=2029981 RepID=A0A418R675_9BACT|nr:hypothetical protein [Hymenobacter rubripertinctus]RIY12896.1 hypothetical protein D0T11_03990 [Hymenobacter rubripertinctus]